MQVSQHGIPATMPILVLLNKGKQIIKAVMLEHQVLPEDFFERQLKTKPLIRARADAANRLAEQDYKYAEIARLLRRNPSTIRNYLSPEYRERKREKHSSNWSKRRVLAILAPDVREIILAFSKAEGVQPETIIAEWVRERAEHEEQARRQAA